MIIPPDHLSAEALTNLVQEYCLRDWGLNETEAPLSERQHQVLQALHRGELVILYSELHETAQLVERSRLTMSEEH